MIARDAIIKPRPDKIAWAIAFGLFTFAAGAEVFGSATEWSPTLARVYYLAGATLVVGYLAVGELYLLAANRIQRFAPGATLLVTAIAATLVLNAPVDETKLATDGWDALERGPALIGLSVTINALGTLVLVGGLGYSAWRFKKLRIQRNRMIGCLLIAVGTIVVGMGGTLTRLGQHEYLYIAMTAGVTMIFAGYLWTRRPDIKTTESLRPSLPDFGHTPKATEAAANGTHAATNGARLQLLSTVEPEIAFIESKLEELDETGLSALCAEWSVPPREGAAFERDEARQAWVLRSRLSDHAQRTFDGLSVPVRRQLSELLHEVMTAGTRR